MSEMTPLVRHEPNKESSAMIDLAMAVDDLLGLGLEPKDILWRVEALLKPCEEFAD